MRFLYQGPEVVVVVLVVVMVVEVMVVVVVVEVVVVVVVLVGVGKGWVLHFRQHIFTMREQKYQNTHPPTYSPTTPPLHQLFYNYILQVRERSE